MAKPQPKQPKTKPRQKSDVVTGQARQSAQKKTVLVKMTTAQLQKFNVWLADEKAKKAGALSTYKPEYCAGVIQFFKKICDVPYNVVEQIVKKKDGTPIMNRAGEPLIDKTLVPNTPPYLVDYAMEVGVRVTTLQDWAIAHPDFNDALMHAKELRTKMLVNNGMIGLYNPNSWIFAAKNLSNMTDRTDITSKGDQVFNVKLQSFDKPDETTDLNPHDNVQIKAPILH